MRTGFSSRAWPAGFGAQEETLAVLSLSLQPGNKLQRHPRNVEQAPPIHFRCSWGPVQGQMLLGSCSTEAVRAGGHPQPGPNTWLGCHPRGWKGHSGDSKPQSNPSGLQDTLPYLSSPTTTFSGQTSKIGQEVKDYLPDCQIIIFFPSGRWKSFNVNFFLKIG